MASDDKHEVEFISRKRNVRGGDSAHHVQVQKIKTLIFVFVSLLAVGTVLLLVVKVAGGASNPKRRACELVRVVSGDTVEVEVGGRPETVRLRGIQIPEDEEDAVASAATLAFLLVDGELSLELEGRLLEYDEDGMLSGYLFAGDTNVNVEMVRKGAARHDAQSSLGMYEKEFFDATFYSTDE